jgi:hypothetical protein
VEVEVEGPPHGGPPPQLVEVEAEVEGLVTLGSIKYVKIEINVI